MWERGLKCLPLKEFPGIVRPMIPNTAPDTVISVSEERFGDHLELLSEMSRDFAECGDIELALRNGLAPKAAPCSCLMAKITKLNAKPASARLTLPA